MSDFLWSCGLWPVILLWPWDFPGKNTGVGCHFLLQGSFWPRDWTCVFCISRGALYHWATREAKIVLSTIPCNRDRDTTLCSMFKKLCWFVRKEFLLFTVIKCWYTISNIYCHSLCHIFLFVCFYFVCLFVLFFLFGLTGLAHINMELNDITDCGMLPRFNVIDIDILTTACLIICLLQLILLKDILLRFFRRLDWYTSCSSPRLVWEKSSEKGHILTVCAHICGSVYHQIHVHTPSFLTECTQCYYSNSTVLREK